MVERSITTLVEQTAVTVKGVKKTISVSSEGLARIDLAFQKKTNMDLARLELSEKMAALSPVLPHDAYPGQIQHYIPKEYADLQGFLSYRLYGAAGLPALQRYGWEKVRPALLGVKGVSEVQIKGGANREIRVLLDEDRLKSLNIGLEQVLHAIRNASFQLAVGREEQGGTGRTLTIGSEVRHVQDLTKIWLPNPRNRDRPLALSEFCIVKDTLAVSASIVRINGKSAVTVEIDKEPGINMLKTAAAVEAVMVGLQKAFPAGIAIEKVMDRGADISTEINELSGKSLFSALCVLLILFFFFHSLRASLAVFVSVVFSIAGAIIYLSITQIGLNIVTLSALALSFGVIVDNAVVVFENIQRQIKSAPADNLMDNIQAGTNELRLPLLAATTTTIGALIPIIFLPDNLRTYFIQFAWTAAVTLGISYPVAVTFIPAACLWLHRRPEKEWLWSMPPARLTRGRCNLKTAYQKLILWNLRHKKWILIFSVLLIGLPFWMLPAKLSIKPLQPMPSDQRAMQQIKNNGTRLYNKLMDNDFMKRTRPYVDHVLGGASYLFFNYVYRGELWKMGFDTYIVVYVQAPQGTEMNRLDDYGRWLEAALSRNGQVIRRFITQISSRSVYIRVDFDRQTALTAAPLVIKDQLTAMAAGSSGFSVSVFGFGPGFSSGGGSSSNYTIQILGYNYSKVKELAQKISEVLTLNARVADIQIDRLPWQTKEYELVGKVDREALYRHHIALDDFLTALAVKLRRGISSQRAVIGQEAVHYSLLMKHPMPSSSLAVRTDAEDVQSLLTSSIAAGGKIVRIGDIIRIELQPVMAEIKREDQQYARFISYDYKGPTRLGDRFLDGVLASIPTAVGYEVKRPDYSFYLGKKETIPMLLIAVGSLLIVFMIAAALFESMRLPFIILFSVPMSLIGLFLGFYFFNVNFSRGGYAAVILLIGLSVNNGIILVSRIERLIQEAGAGRIHRISEAVIQRTRPILITTLTTIASFVPFVLNSDTYSFWYTFAFAVICGLATSTILILLVMPVLYDVISAKRYSAKTA